MTTAESIMSEIHALANEEKREVLQKFFKTGKGEYGSGDKFLGVTVPQIRAVAKANRDVGLKELEPLVCSEWHEVRLCALLVLVQKMSKATSDEGRLEIYDFYLSHTRYINNWDLVDLSAPHVVGAYLSGKPHDRLYELAASNLLWDNRIAVVATYAFIKKNDCDDIYRLAVMLINHPHDLMHKAIGWMLREAGKRDKKRLAAFLEEYRLKLPRTTLRYAIEKMSPEERRHFMRKDL